MQVFKDILQLKEKLESESLSGFSMRRSENARTLRAPDQYMATHKQGCWEFGRLLKINV